MVEGQPNQGGIELTALPAGGVDATSSSPPQARANPVAGAILGVLLALIIALTVAEIVAAFVPLYRPALREAAVREQLFSPAGRLPASADEFETALVHILAYCNGRVDDAQVLLRAATAEGEVLLVPGLSPDEVAHLADVRWLFAAAKQLRNLMAFFLVGVLIPLAMTAPQRFRQYARLVLLWTGGGTLVLLAGGLMAVTGGFDAAFEGFHRLLFSNDLWLLPADSLLITMLPGWLFARLAAIIAVGTAVIGGLAGLMGLRWRIVSPEGTGGQS